MVALAHHTRRILKDSVASLCSVALAGEFLPVQHADVPARRSFGCKVTKAACIMPFAGAVEATWRNKVCERHDTV
jgi:hypothetical protein